jgi:hypothetical protein
MAKEYNYLNNEADDREIVKFGVHILLWCHLVEMYWYIPEKYVSTVNRMVKWTCTGGQDEAQFLGADLKLLVDYDRGWYVQFRMPINMKGLFAEVRKYVFQHGDDEYDKYFMEEVIRRRKERINKACYDITRVKEFFINSARMQFYGGKLVKDYDLLHNEGVTNVEVDDLL